LRVEMAQAKKAQDDATANLGFEAKLWAAAAEIGLEGVDVSG
jgi:hypothetical protein